MPSKHVMLCHPHCLPSWIFPRIRVFSNESVFLHQVAKVLELQLQHQSSQWIFRTVFLYGDPAKGLRNPREFDFGGQWDLITVLSQDGETDSWRAQTKPCAHKEPGERSNTPTRDCVCPGVSREGMDQQYPALGSGALNTTVLGSAECWHKSFWKRSPLSRTTWKRHSPIHQQKIGWKIYWAWLHPSEQDPDFPTASPSNQEASTSLFSSSIRGWTEWKPQSQKTNQTYHMDHSLV